MDAVKETASVGKTEGLDGGSGTEGSGSRHKMRGLNGAGILKRHPYCGYVMGFKLMVDGPGAVGSRTVNGHCLTRCALGSTLA